MPLSTILQFVRDQLQNFLTSRSSGIPAREVRALLETLDREHATITARAQENAAEATRLMFELTGHMLREFMELMRLEHETLRLDFGKTMDQVQDLAREVVAKLEGGVRPQTPESMPIPAPRPPIPDVVPAIVPPSQLLLEELRAELEQRNRFRYAPRGEQVGPRAYLALQEHSTGVIFVLMVEGRTWEIARVVCYCATSVAAFTLEDEYAAAILAAREGRARTRFQARQGERPRAIVDRLEEVCIP